MALSEAMWPAVAAPRTRRVCTHEARAQHLKHWGAGRKFVGLEDLVGRRDDSTAALEMGACAPLVPARS